MTVFSNLRGTSEINFRIGITGPTIYTGNADPNVTGPLPIDVLNIGDVYFHSGGLGNPWFYDGTNWNQAVSTGTGGTIINGNTTVNGDLTVTGQGLFADGTTAAPSIAFAADTDTGIYRRGTNQIGFVTSGVERFYIDSADAIRGSNLQIRGRAGTAAAPTYAFEGDNNTGMYNVGPNAIGFSTGSTTALTLDNTAAATFASDVTVQGDLVVNGTTTTVNSANLNVADNIITINDGEVGAGVSLGVAGLEVDRGSLPEASILFDDVLDEWRIGLTTTPAIAIRQPDGVRATLSVLSTDAFLTAAGTTAQRPSSPVDGMFRYNSTLNTMESYVNGSWESIPSAVAGNNFLLDTNNLSDLTNVATARTNLGLVAGGAGDIWVEKAGDTMTGDLTMGGGTQILLPTGSITDPALTFTGDPDTGIFNTGTDDIGFSTGGFESVQFTNGGQIFARDGAASSVLFRRSLAGAGTLATLSFQGPNSVSAITTMARITAVADNITDGAEEGRIDILGMESGTLSTMARFQDSRIRGGSSSNALPMFARINDTNTGISLPGSDIGRLIAGGTSILEWKIGGSADASMIITTTDALQLPDGTTVQRPTAPVNGMFRYNNTTNQFEGFENGSWEQLATTGGSGGTYLAVANNLSDLSNAATARTNIGLVAGGAGDIWVEKSGDTMTGDLDMGNNGFIINPTNPTTGAHVGDRAYNDARYLLESNNLSDLTNVTTALTNLGLNAGGAADIWVEKAGDTMTGDLNMANNGFILNPTNPTSAAHVGDRGYNDARYLLESNNLSDLTNVNTALTNLGLNAGGAADIWVEKAGDTMSGTLNMGNNLITNVANPTSAAHVGDRGFNDARYLLESNNLSDLTSVATARTNIGLVAGGAGDIWVEKAGDTMTGNLTMSGSAEIRIINGAANNPSFTFASDQDTGIYRAGTNAVGVTTGGLRHTQFSPNNIFLFGQSAVPFVNLRREGVVPNGSGTGGIDFEGGNAANTPITYGRIQGVVDSNATGNEESRMDFATRESGGLTTTMRLQDGRLRLQNSSAGSPMFSDLSDANTGMHLPSNDTIEHCTAGVMRTRTTNQDLQLNSGIDLYFNNNALIANNSAGAGASHSAGTNVDHIWHNDSNNTWHFVSDAAYKSTGNSTLQGTAVAALYADLAERYEADAEYPEGTILIIGGDKEVTTTDKAAHHAVAGLVSLYPAFKMNNTDDHQSPLWPYVALAGRVPCRVIGKVSKGDRMGTSDTHGVAMSLETSLVSPGVVVGIAMEDYNGDGEGMIEVMVRSA